MKNSVLKVPGFSRRLAALGWEERSWLSMGDFITVIICRQWPKRSCKRDGVGEGNRCGNFFGRNDCLIEKARAGMVY